MKENFTDQYPKEVQSKAKRMIVWIVVVSIMMMFAGFTSAYLVSMGDNFWIKVNLPKAFYISTVLIIISSFTLFAAHRFVKKNKLTQARVFIILTLFLGMGFAFFQYQGYKGLVKKGAYWVSGIVVDKGRYGDYYELKKGGDYFTIENNQYFYEGNPISMSESENLSQFAKQFMVKDLTALKNVKIDFKDYTLLYKSEPLSYSGGELLRPNGEKLNDLDFERLFEFMQNIKDDRADFFVSGELGKDFRLYFNGNEMDYKERTLLYKGQPLSANLQNKLLRGNSDTSTAYFYVITILHLLHVIAGIIMLTIMSIRSYTAENSYKMEISIRSGSIFWHFLGILWVYLLLFLIFIH